MGSDLKKVIEALERGGFVVSRTRKNHFNVSTADGESITTFAGIPVRWTGIPQRTGSAETAGIQWPPRR